MVKYADIINEMYDDPLAPRTERPVALPRRTEEQATPLLANTPHHLRNKVEYSVSLLYCVMQRQVFGKRIFRRMVRHFRRFDSNSPKFMISKLRCTFEDDFQIILIPIEVFNIKSGDFIL